MNKIDLTKQDLQILDLLQRDAGKTSGEIADTLNMSQSPCWRRINKIEQAGIIRKKVALLDREKLGMELVVFTTVNLTQVGRKNLEAFEAAMRTLPEVVECYTMAGVWDYMLKIVAKDIRHYEVFVREKLLALEMIGESHSHISVTEIKNTTELPLDTQL
ncbi:Lrp/AsnC family transcriptional regulator [Spongiibacter sp. KMU-158]|uniref:Lrp/AsnC family transcriptional regulator n=1 Tax=Spongiibacter pelagi TaxID=2760804 RepID=A0A927C5K3_9GAMM|nr:Lrp/AsnC family transcriptional regulator [Spongiibacter pelagi]MBD2859810.1 Lrp/AsnC family transcriptional regulator [Spongiibacter pelagi]